MLVNRLLFFTLFFSISRKTLQQDVTNTPWLSRIFTQAEAEFEIHESSSKKCKEDYFKYQLHLRNNTIWAVRMLESSEWPSVGLFAGTTRYFGNFDECLSIEATGIKGQYCLIEGHLDFIDLVSSLKQSKQLEEISPENSTWEALQMYELDDNRVNRKIMNWAVCIPSSCTVEDLDISLEHLFNKINSRFQITIKTRINPGLCKKNEIIELPNEYYATRNLFGMIFTFVILLTILDYQFPNLNDKSSVRRWINSFSIKRNYWRLMHVTPSKELKLIHFEKVLLVFYLLIIHIAFECTRYHPRNIEDFEQMIKSYNIAFLSSHPPSVLFFISGFIMSCSFFEIAEVSFQNIALVTFKRWLRLFLTYLFVRIVFAFYIPYINTGPIWHEIVDEVKYCYKNWLETIFCFPSATEWDKICILPLWQIIIDFKISIVASSLLYITTKNQKLGIILIILSMVLTALLSFSTEMRYQYNPMPMNSGKLRIGISTRDIKNEVINGFHTSFQMNFNDYMIGVLTVYLARVIKKENYTFKLAYQILVLVISISLDFYGKKLGHDLYMNKESEIWKKAMLVALHPIFFMLPFAVFHFIYFTRCKNYIDNLISWIFVPLSRLTYCISLINIIVIQYVNTSRKAVMTEKELVLLQIVVLTYSLAFGLFLFVEGPVQRITSIFLNYMENNLFSDLKEKILKNFHFLQLTVYSVLFSDRKLNKKWK